MKEPSTTPTAMPPVSKKRGRPPKPSTSTSTTPDDPPPQTTTIPSTLEPNVNPSQPSKTLQQEQVGQEIQVTNEQEHQVTDEQQEQQVGVEEEEEEELLGASSTTTWLQTSATQSLDLAAHSVLCYELLGGEGTERVPGESDEAFGVRLWAEWEEKKKKDSQSMGIAPGSDSVLDGQASGWDLPPGPLLRCKMVKVLSLLKLIGRETDETGMDEGQTFAARKAVAEAYEVLQRVLTAGFAEEKFVNSSAFISILVELKSQFIVAEMYAGLKENGDPVTYRNYRKGEGKALIKSVFDTSALPNLPEMLLPKVKAIFEQREGAIIQLLNQGRMTFDEYPLPELEAQLRVFLARIFKDLNEKRLPDMHPDYQEVSVSRTSRGNGTSALDPDSLSTQLHRDQMAQLLNAVEMVTQRSQNAAQAVMKNMHDASSRFSVVGSHHHHQVYSGLPGIVDEFDSPFDSMSAAMSGSPVLSAGLGHPHLHLTPNGQASPTSQVRSRSQLQHSHQDGEDVNGHGGSVEDQDGGQYHHQDPAYDTENAWVKRQRTDGMDDYQPPSNIHIVLDPKNPLSPFQSGRTTPRRRPPGTKVPWTQEETDALEQGMNIFGNDWKAIKDHFRDILSRRSNVNLKDRARNIKRKLVKSGHPLGIWANACN